MGFFGRTWAALRLALACLALACLALGLSAAAGAAWAQDRPDGSPALIHADQVRYDESLGVVTASGNVEIAQGERVLKADSVSYNLRSNVVSASGNVALLEPTGETLFADFVELTDDLKEGFIRDVRVLLSDHRSRLAAAGGLRTNDETTRLSKGVYSPCELCREDPTRAPLWQLKAVEVEHDRRERVIRYRDAWMEIYGIPVFYTPYFEHPDPTVERKSGFLAPSIGSNDHLGFNYQQPYYWTIGPDRDVTFAPIFTENQGVVLTGEYRELFSKGRVDIRASGTQADRTETDGTIETDRFRGHIDGTARFDIDELWRGGVDVQRTTDPTYLRVYDFSNERTLTSRAFVERLEGRNYAAINNFLYQGLRGEDVQGELPIVHPLAEFSYLSDPDPFGLGGRVSVDASLLSLSRDKGRDSNRASLAVGWQRPFVGPLGDVYTLTARIAGDGYLVDGVDPNSDDVNPSGSTFDGTTGRVYPQLALQWRYPWASHQGGVHQVIEPVAQIVVAPNAINSGKIPNEDSLDFEFDDTNLFSLNRFTGVDRIDPGTRFDYGLRWTGTLDTGGYASAFVGQSYRLEEEPDLFPEGSGLEDQLSDVVGRFHLRPVSGLDLQYRFRLDQDELDTRRNELDLRVGPPALNLSLGYTFLKSVSAEDEFGDREELTWQLNSRLNRYWSLFGGQRIDLTSDTRLSTTVGAVYEDECFLVQGIFQRSEFRDRDIRPSDSFFVNVVFKTLGELPGRGSAP